MQDILTTYGYLILNAAALLIPTWILTTLVYKASAKWIKRNDAFDTPASIIVIQIIRVIIIFLVCLVVLDGLGIDIRTIIAALSIFGFALAIGMRPATTNFFSGIMLKVLQPYKAGEYIEGERVTGYVESVNIFHTVVITAEGTFVVVPNTAMWTRSIKNLSRTYPVRIELDVIVERQLPFEKISDVIEQILLAQPTRNSQFRLHIKITSTAKNAMTIRVADWYDPEYAWDALDHLTKELRTGITKAGAVVTKITAAKKVVPREKTISTRSDSGGDEVL